MGRGEPAAHGDAAVPDAGGDGSASGATPALPPELVEAARRLEDGSAEAPRAWERLAYLSDSFYPRLSGSRGLEDAIDWSLEQLREDGLTAVRREKVMVPHWVRGEEWARVVEPVDRPLGVLGIGGTVGTGPRPLRARVEVVGSLEELDRRGEELRGAIVVIDQAMPEYDPEKRSSGYGELYPIRSHSASRAAKVGAVAVLARSLTARSLATPHTGMLRYDEGVTPIPAACLTVEDSARLRRMRERGPVVVELSLGARTLPDAESANAIGEIRGTELPDEVVLIGAHIDGWDVGDNASDDGSGCVMVMEAARMLAEAKLAPRRTIRVVLFTNEENGMRGAKAYQAAHGGERHVAAIEADSGAGAPWGFQVQGTKAQLAGLQRYAPLFHALGADHIVEGFAGVDLIPLTEAGVLGVGLEPDGSTYFDTHHSPADTVDKVDPAHLQKNAAALALLAYLLATVEPPGAPER